MLSKRVVLEDLLRHGSVLVCVHKDYPGVSLPHLPEFQERVALRFGYNLKPDIVDLATDDYSLSGTLVFNGKPAHCTLPWGSIFALNLEHTAHYINWPPEVAVEVKVEEKAARPRLSLVE